MKEQMTTAQVKKKTKYEITPTPVPPPTRPQTYESTTLNLSCPKASNDKMMVATQASILSFERDETRCKSLPSNCY